MIEAIKVVACLAVTAGAGAAFLRLFSDDAGRTAAGSRRRSGTATLGWCFLAGTALVSVALHLPLALDGTIDHSWFAVVCALSSLATLWFARVAWRNWRATRGAADGKRSWILSLPVVLRILTVVIVACVVWFNVAAPLTTYDSRAIYGLKARVLYDLGSVRGEDFLDSARAHYHPHYPLLLPLHEAYLFWAQGSNDDSAIKWISAAFSLALVGVFVDELRRHTTDVTAAFWGLNLLFTPMLLSGAEGGGLSGSADAPFAAFVLAAFVQLGRWFEEPRWRPAALAGLFLGAATLTKQEGAFCLAAAALAAAFLCTRQRMWNSQSVQAAVAAGTAVAVCIGLSALARAGLAESPFVPDYAMAFRSDWLMQLWHRPAEFLSYLFSQFVNWRVWNLAWPLLAAALFLRRPPPDGTVRFWRITLVLVSCAYCGTFMITPYNLQYQMSTALNRLAFHLFPLALLVLSEQLFASGLTTRIPARQRGSDSLQPRG